MRREQFQNDSQTTLNASVLTTDVTINVVDGTVFPAAGDFRVLVDDGTDALHGRITGNTLTVTRRQEGTTPGGARCACRGHASRVAGRLAELPPRQRPAVRHDAAAFRIMDANQNRLSCRGLHALDYSGGNVASDFGNSIVLQGGGGAYLTRPIPGGPTWTLDGGRQDDGHEHRVVLGRGGRSASWTRATSR